MNGIELAGKFIPYYGIMIVIGLAVSSLMYTMLIRHFHLVIDDMLILAAYAIAGGLVGAKLLSLFFLWEQINWKKMLEWEYVSRVLQSGYVFYGGLLMGLASALLAGHLHKFPAAAYIKAGIPCVPLAHGFGRIGCYLAGCCYGIPYKGAWHVIYQKPSFAPVGIPLFPVQLLEAYLNFVTAGGLFLFVYKRGLSYRNVCLYLFIYAIERFGLEYIRYDTEARGSFWIFSTSQWISIGILISVVLFLYRKKGRHSPSHNI